MIKKCSMICLTVLMVLSVCTAVPVLASEGLEELAVPAVAWQNFTLPAQTPQGDTVTWTSSDETVISSTGVVARPAFMEESETVILTAQAGGSAKSFEVFVPHIAPFGKPVVMEDFTDENSLKLQLDKGSFAGGTTDFVNEDGYTALKIGKAEADGKNDARLSMLLPEKAGTTEEPIVDVRAKLKAAVVGNAHWLYAGNGSIISRVSPHSSGSFLVAQYNNGDQKNVGGTPGTWVELRHRFHFDTTDGRTPTVSIWSDGVLKLDEQLTYRKGISDLGTDVARVYADIARPSGYEETYVYYDYIAVAERPSDDKAALIADAKAALDLGDLSAVSTNLTLPDTSGYAEVQWVSSNPELIAPDGTVTLPETGEEDVTLTAVILCDDAVETKEFTAHLAADEEKDINEDIDSVSIPEILKENIVIANPLPNGTVAEILTNDADVLAADGTVTRPKDKSRYLAFQIRFTNGEQEVVKDYTAIVPKEIPASSQDGYFQNFENVTADTLDTIGYTLDASMTKNGITDIIEDDISGSKVFSIKNTAAKGDYTPNLKFANVSGKVVIEFDARMNGMGNLLYAYGDEATFTMTTNAAGVLDVRLRSGSYQPLKGIDPNRWYHVKILLDNTPVVNGTGDSAFWFWVDGQPAGENLVPRANSAYVNRFLIGVSSGSEYRYDNFKVYPDCSDDVKNALGQVAVEGLDAIMEDLSLTKQLDGGVSIEWISSDERYIRPDGTVTRPAKGEKDQTVKLYALVRKNDTHELKAFDATVKAQYADEDSVEYDWNQLNISGLEDVRSELMLPTRGANNTLITWTSSDGSIIKIENGKGVVTRPSYLEGKRYEEVTLTATITKGTVSKVKTFTAKVPKMNYAYKKSVSASSSMSGNTYLNLVDENYETWWQPKQTTGQSILIDLTKDTFLSMCEIYPKGEVGSVSLEYSTDNITYKPLTAPTLINGRLVSSFPKIKARYIKASFASMVADSGVYEMELYRITDAEDVEADIAWLNQRIKDNSSITSDMDLPEQGENGSAISWKSDTPSSITDDGKVTRKTDDVTVILTATLTKGSTTETLNKKVIVKGTSSGSGGSGGGGGVSQTGGGSTNINTVLPGRDNMEEPIVEKKIFEDLGQVAWAEEAIEALYEKGVVNGRADKQFAPQEQVTRAEFVKMIAQILELPEAQGSFDDVAENSWYESFIYAAANAGIVTGDNGSFYPDNNISREDMAVIICRALVYAEKAATAAGELSFDDANDIAPYAKEAVQTLVEMKIMQGTGVSFEPKRGATRAEAAKVIYAVCQIVEQ